MKQVVIRQTSGLGNQLFQYAAGKYFAKKYGTPLRIASEFPKKLSSRGHPRPFLLAKFAISAPAKTASAFDRLVLSEKPILSTVARPIRGILGIQVIREAETQKFKFTKDIPIRRATRTAYFVGYWQAYQIAESVQSELRSEISIRDPLKGKSTEVLDQIDRAKQPVSIHLRRGDYAAVFGEDSLLPLAYYNQAVKRLKDYLETPTFFVFSDEPILAREFARAYANCVVVDHNDGASAHEDLHLMSRCHHHVIANSSFSWWGAWLNPRSDKHVIAPAKWLQHNTRSTDLLPPNWEIIDS